MQGTDGRSRGFGTVLYANHEDAKRAIGIYAYKVIFVLCLICYLAMYNGYEFHGRRLRVHFDKFASAATGSHQKYPSVTPHHHSTPPPPVKPPLEHLTQPYPPPSPSPYHAQSSPLLTPFVYFASPESAPTYHHQFRQQQQQPVTPLTDEDNNLDFGNPSRSYLPKQPFQENYYPFHALMYPQHARYLNFTGFAAASRSLESSVQSKLRSGMLYACPSSMLTFFKATKPHPSSGQRIQCMRWIL